MNTLLENIGNNIQLARTQQGLTQKDLADICGYNDRSTIARIEHGTVDVPITKLSQIAVALHIPPNELLNSAIPNDGNSENDRKKRLIMYLLQLCTDSQLDKLINIIIKYQIEGEK